MLKTLLVPLDRSSLAEQALIPAMDLAKKWKAGIELVLVHLPVRVLGVSAMRRTDTEQWHDDDRYLAHRRGSPRSS